MKPRQIWTTCWKLSVKRKRRRFSDGSFQVVPDQDDGQMIKAAAEGMESSMESTTVFL